MATASILPNCQNPFDDLDLRMAVEQEVSRLEPDELVILQASANGLSNGQIAQVFGCSTAWIQRRLSKVRQQLRTRLLCDVSPS